MNMEQLSMEEREVLRLISQHLHERGFRMSLEILQKESGRKFNPDTMIKKTGELQAALDEYSAAEKQKESIAASVEHLFEPGKGEHANELWCSFDDLTGGVNVLAVQLIETGALAFGASKAVVGTAQLPLPLSASTPPPTPISTSHMVCKGAVLALDFHPINPNLLLCGSMDRISFLLDLEKPEDSLIQKFENHTKYVTRVQWTLSGKYFVTGSYDKTVCVYRALHYVSGDKSLYELAQKLDFKGTIEALTCSKETDSFVVGVRNDYRLHCFDISSGSAVKTREINMNASGDDYVSFTAMHISFSPDGKYLLVSTDRDRLIMYIWETGKQVANFYGATNDEYSQPRHCWDPSGKYIYGTSQDKSICVWEIRSQSIVQRLEGHTGTVRDLHYCKDLGLLVSCGFDGAVKLWRTSPTETQVQDKADC